MVDIAIAVVAVALAVVILLSSLRVGFAILVASMLLVPGGLPVLASLVHFSTFTRIQLAAVLIRLLLGIYRGEFSRTVFRWTVVHTAYVVFLFGVFVTGVVFAIQQAAELSATEKFISLIDEFLFFVVLLACIRAIANYRWILGVVTAVLAASAGIGIVEHVTGQAWGHFLFHGPTNIASHVLESRAGVQRVRAGADFALQYAWVTVMLIPALLAWLGSIRRRWFLLSLPLILVVLLADYWAYSRSAFAAAGAVVLLFALAARDRRLTYLALLGVAVAGISFLLIGSLQHGYLGLPPGPVNVRTERIPRILQAVSQHPLRGLGLGGLSSLDISTTDASFLQLYGETGIVGVIGGVGLLVAATAACLPGLRSAWKGERLAAAAAVAATAAMIVSTFAYDSLIALTSARVFFLVVALGVVATENVRGPLPALMPRRPQTLVASIVVAEAVGWVVFALTPVHYARQYQFLTVPIGRESRGLYDPVTAGTTLIDTVCGEATALQRVTPGLQLECRDLRQGAGVGELRVQAASRARVEAGVARVRAAAAATGISTFELAAETPLLRGRDTAPAWAPFWLPIGTALWVLYVPLRLPPRRRAEPPSATAIAGTPALAAH